MEGYLATLLLKPVPQQPDPNLMSRRLFRTKTEALLWIAAQRVPTWAYGYWIEEFDEEGRMTCMQAVKGAG